MFDNPDFAGIVFTPPGSPHPHLAPREWGQEALERLLEAAGQTDRGFPARPVFYAPSPRQFVVLWQWQDVEGSPNAFTTTALTPDEAEQKLHALYGDVDVYGVHQGSLDEAFDSYIERTA